MLATKTLCLSGAVLGLLVSTACSSSNNTGAGGSSNAATGGNATGPGATTTTSGPSASAGAGASGVSTTGAGASGAATTGAGASGASTTGAGGSGAATTGSGESGPTSTTSGASTTSSSSGGAAGGLFQAPEPWNTPVDTAPVDPASSTIIPWLAAKGWGTGSMRIDFSINIQYADSSTPFKAYTQNGNFYTPDCDVLPGFPVPAGGAVEGEQGYACTQGGDCHFLVVDKANNKLYEMYDAFDPPSSSVFNGGCSVLWDLTKAYPPNLRGDGCTSTDAGGFPVAAMLFTADEVAAGHVDHAIRFILPNSSIRGGNVYVHPSTHTTSATSGDKSSAPPYGVHLRLSSSFDMSKLPSAGAQVVAKALQKYGMFLADGGNIALTAADDRFTTAKWTDANVNMDSHALSALQVSDFEVVDMGSPIASTGDCVRNP